VENTFCKKEESRKQLLWLEQKSIVSGKRKTKTMTIGVANSQTHGMSKSPETYRIDLKATPQNTNA
jgi:hypothetical protein